MIPIIEQLARNKPVALWEISHVKAPNLTSIRPSRHLANNNFHQISTIFHYLDDDMLLRATKQKQSLLILAKS